MALPLKITLVTALLLLAACRSEPIQFHTLTPVHRSNASLAAGGEIRIESITVPPQVDRPQIVIRQGDSGVAILETQWWPPAWWMSCAVRWWINSPATGKTCRCALKYSALTRFPGSTPCSTSNGGFVSQAQMNARH